MSWKKGNKPGLLPEQDADATTTALYREIEEETFGMPHDLIFLPALAVYPGFLPCMWRALRPAVTSEEFLHAAQCIGADAYTRVYSYLEVPDLWSDVPPLPEGDAARRALAATAEAFQYRDSLFLLLFSLLLRAIEGPVGMRVALPLRRTAAPQSLVLREVFDLCAAGVPITGTPPETSRFLEDIRRSLKFPFINTEFRVLARYPGFLKVYWPVLKMLLESALSSEWTQGAREMAWEAAPQLPGPVEITAEELQRSGLSEDNLAAIMGVTQMLIHNLSQLIFGMVLAKVSLEGGNHAPIVRPAPPSGREEPGQSGRVA